MSSPMGFFTLSRELRDNIYYHYVFEPDGYHYDYESGKFRASGNRSIDLALTYSCKSIAAEMHHLALGNNILHFSTISSDRFKAARFARFFWQLQCYKRTVLQSLVEPSFQHYRTPDVDAEAASRYPQFQSLLPSLYQPGDKREREDIERGCLYSGWGETDSTFRAFQNFMIELLSRDTDFPEALAQFYETISINPRRAQMDFPEAYLEFNSDPVPLGMASLLSGPDPWIIPSEEDLSKMETTLGHSRGHSFEELAEDEHFWKRIDWRFSAAAAAIHFFKSISQDTLLGIRDIVLHEDRQPVTYPACHMLGLVPFCIQNRRLHIDRRVNVWRNILISGEIQDEMMLQLEVTFEELENEHRSTNPDFEEDCGELFTDRCCKWITEASALSANGMPTGAFNLTLDGDPALEQCTQLFERMQDAAAWQVAQAQWYDEQAFNPGFVSRKIQGIYYSEAFPQAIRDMTAGNSFLHCNFLIGDQCDPKPVLDRNRHLIHLSPDILEEDAEFYGSWWDDQFDLYCSRDDIRLLPPLPPLMADLTLEAVLPVE